MTHWGPKREDMRPKVKQYGNYEAPEDEVVDPKITAAQRDFEARYHKEMDKHRPQKRIARKWTSKTGLVPVNPVSAVGATAPKLPNGEFDHAHKLPEPSKEPFKSETEAIEEFFRENLPPSPPPPWAGGAR